MLDIRSTGFLRCPPEDLPKLIQEGTVGVIGHGYVGKAVEAFFKDTCMVLVYDKKGSPQSLRDVVKNSEVIFLCLPTPMRKDGSCHTSIIDDVLEEVRIEALAQGRPLDTFVMVIKSTVPVGFTEEMQEKYFPMRITFSPEFLTEKNSVDDFKNCNRIIVAGDEDDANIVLAFFCGVVYERAAGMLETKVIDKYTELLAHSSAASPEARAFLLSQFAEELAKVSSKRVVLYHESNPSVAEMIKLYTNGILATKVMFCNEVYQLCEKLGMPYEEVRVGALLDTRIGESHTKVPGHDGQLGYGGHCFPKDVHNLRYIAGQLDVKEKLLSAVIDRNEELREDKDWLRMEGRAVIKL